jgi:hypothetical protein
MRFHDKLLMLVEQIECAEQLLTIQVEIEQSKIINDYYSQLLAVYQKVSLAEKNKQVKNTCSHSSSTID